MLTLSTFKKAEILPQSSVVTPIDRCHPHNWLLFACLFAALPRCRRQRPGAVRDQQKDPDGSTYWFNPVGMTESSKAPSTIQEK